MTIESVKTSNITKYISIAILILAPALSFYVWSKVEISVIKEDLILYRTIYNKDIKTLEKRLDNISNKETHIEQMLQDIMSDLKVIKHELKLR